ncbi:hypothetical protein B484DRAFT_437066 [Ochromonadaceae sp. CCMP2298]|nr:hypothetical protein B484DRAFT_437066 [Ochromonadaceae sp. CCMP2298]
MMTFLKSGPGGAACTGLTLDHLYTLLPPKVTEQPRFSCVFEFEVFVNHKGGTAQWNSATLDRILSWWPYVPGRVLLMSFVANAAKTDTSPYEWTLLAKDIEARWVALEAHQSREFQAQMAQRKMQRLEYGGKDDDFYYTKDDADETPCKRRA